MSIGSILQYSRISSNSLLSQLRLSQGPEIFYESLEFWFVTAYNKFVFWSISFDIYIYIYIYIKNRNNQIMHEDSNAAIRN